MYANSWSINNGIKAEQQRVAMGRCPVDAGLRADTGTDTGTGRFTVLWHV